MSGLFMMLVNRVTGDRISCACDGPRNVAPKIILLVAKEQYKHSGEETLATASIGNAPVSSEMRQAPHSGRPWRPVVEPQHALGAVRNGCAPAKGARPGTWIPWGVTAAEYQISGYRKEDEIV